MLVYENVSVNGHVDEHALLFRCVRVKILHQTSRELGGFRNYLSRTNQKKNLLRLFLTVREYIRPFPAWTNWSMLPTLSAGAFINIFIHEDCVDFSDHLSQTPRVDSGNIRSGLRRGVRIYYS